MRKAAIIGFGLCALGAIEPLWATVFDAPGGSGDYTVEARCKPSEMDYLVGFAFRTGWWMDQITPICAPLKSAVQFGAKRHLKSRGGNGGSPSEHYCSDGEVISAIQPYFYEKEKKTIMGIDFVCSSLKTWAAHTISVLQPAHGAPEPRQECPYGELASGIQVRWGRYVNAIGLICDRFKVPVAKQAPPPKQAPPQTCNDRCAMGKPVHQTQAEANEANRVHHNCLALCNRGPDDTIICPDLSTVKVSERCK
jgi:hypothetical protein